MEIRLVLIQALTPLHAGTGQAVGAIDLPIARERPTGIPLVPGSSIKGALRARAPEGEPWCTAAFGPKTDQASEHAGAVQLADAHLVLMPVRSLKGTFALVTSPYLLGRLARDAAETGLKLGAPPQLANLKTCHVLGDKLIATLGNANQGRVVLEDLDFTPDKNGAKLLESYIDLLAKILDPEDPEKAGALLRDRICVVHDDAMSYLLETATEVVARIRLDEQTKTVAEGALWYEEALPAESVLIGLALAATVRRQGEDFPGKKLLDHVQQTASGVVQLGGKATVGRGLCRITLQAA
jgi:CRISPR-associated protein Cmr4